MSKKKKKNSCKPNKRVYPSLGQCATTLSEFQCDPVTVLKEAQEFKFHHEGPTGTPFNHSPFVTDVWVERTGWRLKDPYQVRLKSGVELEAFPNGGGWSLVNNQIVEDEEVTHIKLLNDPMFRRNWTGGRKIKRACEYFGTRFPVWVRGYFIKPEDVPETHRFTPTEVFGYRNSDGKVIIMIAKAEIVPNESEDISLDDILQYVDDPLFWWDNETDVMSHNDICSAIHYINSKRKHHLEDPEEAIWLDEFFEKYMMDYKPHAHHRDICKNTLKQLGKDALVKCMTDNLMNEAGNRLKLLKEGKSEMQKRTLDERVNLSRGGRPHYEAGPHFNIKEVLAGNPLYLLPDLG